jgi:hypothetical protein
VPRGSVATRVTYADTSSSGTAPGATGIDLAGGAERIAVSIKPSSGGTICAPSAA